MASRTPFYSVGTYLGEVTQWALGKSSAKGTPQFALRFKVLNEITPEGPQEVTAQYERTTYLYFTDKTIERSLEDLKNLGFDGNSFSMLNDHNFSGVHAEFICQHEEYNGDMREKWGLRGSSSPMEVTPLDAKEIRNLDMLFGKSLKQQKKVQAEPKAKQNAAPLHNESDLLQSNEEYDPF